MRARTPAKVEAPTASLEERRSAEPNESVRRASWELHVGLAIIDLLSVGLSAPCVVFFIFSVTGEYWTCASHTSSPSSRIALRLEAQSADPTHWMQANRIQVFSFAPV